ncbi:hypothetical protein Pcinc_008321 [Petrolisthes cinctipes]|uniref:Uncharacterized protein n=1 Tax=Petrolisthes cinctipes TaxID=88211 RepID=A0AAE1KXN8_PETCI|nr:hypothetical protein Pcinc_008321 [Petrolisthes cinctipes]
MATSVDKCRHGCRNAFVMQLFNFFKNEKEANRMQIGLNKYRMWLWPYRRVAAALRIKVGTVHSIVSRSTRPRRATPPTPPAQPVLVSFTVGAIRRHVHTKFAAKQAFTLASLTGNLKEASIIPESTSKISLWRLLH